MTYILENNYLLESEWSTLTALRFDAPSGTKLFILKPYWEDTVALKPDKKGGDQIEEVDCITLYWSPSKGNLTEEWLDRSESDWREMFTELDLSTIKDQRPNFPLVQLILWHCRDADTSPFVTAISDLFPPFEPLYLQYEIAYKAQGTRIRLWSHDWIGMTDSEENEIFMTVKNDNSVRLEYVDNFTSDAETIEQYIDESTINGQLEISSVDQIKDKNGFLNGFRSLFTSGSKSDLANVVRIDELEINCEDIAGKINAIGLNYTITTDELESIINGLKKKKI